MDLTRDKICREVARLSGDVTALEFILPQTDFNNYLSQGRHLLFIINISKGRA